AGGVVLIEAQSQSRPLFQLPAAGLTLALGALALYASSLAVVGRRLLALTLWGGCALLMILLPLLQVLPVKYETLFLMNLQDLAPPLWPYSLAFPLLLFLVLELALPNRGESRTSILFLFLGLLSSAMLLFFASALVGSMGNGSLLLVPRRLFLSVLTPVGISALIVLATTLVRKGLAKEGIALLLVMGLGIEWVSTWSFDGPHFIEESKFFPYPRFPMLPILAGTLPGAIAAGGGVLGGWEVFVKGSRESPIQPVAGETL
ncbi:MAG: hypothetical protein HYX93_06375, partial [Chloroflexi bacterium]|nr:hypothetical protein [Chloroflexota bacterium]